jgi:hypothetical protein
MALSSIEQPPLVHRIHANFSLRTQEALGAALYLNDGVGQFLGGIGALVTFLSIMLLAYGSFDLLRGLLVGWIGGGLAALAVYVVVRYLWPLPVMLVLMMLLS